MVRLMPAFASAGPRSTEEEPGAGQRNARQQQQRAANVKGAKTQEGGEEIKEGKHNKGKEKPGWEWTSRQR